jgi:hypothetical protein
MRHSHTAPRYSHVSSVSSVASGRLGAPCAPSSKRYISMFESGRGGSSHKSISMPRARLLSVVSIKNPWVKRRRSSQAGIQLGTFEATRTRKPWAASHSVARRSRAARSTSAPNATQAMVRPISSVRSRHCSQRRLICVHLKYPAASMSASIGCRKTHEKRKRTNGIFRSAPFATSFSS